MPLYENVTGRMIFYWFSYIGVSPSFFSPWPPMHLDC